MKIFKKTLEAADACKDQVILFEQWLGKRKYCRITKHNLLSAHDAGLDVIWAAKEGLLGKIDWSKFALGAAERVAPIYRQQYPEDDRVDRCIDVTRKYIAGEATWKELLVARADANAAAYAAAYAAADAAYCAADAAYNAAYNAANAAYYAADAAYYAAYYAAASAAYYAADAAYYAVNAAGAAEKRWQIELLWEFICM